MNPTAGTAAPGLIKCPVCERPPTTEEKCPHCGTDLGPLWRLFSLPLRLRQQGMQLWEESPEAGLEYLTAASVLEPQSVSSRLALGQAMLGQGRLAQALVQAEQALAIDPENPDAQSLKDQTLEAMSCHQAIAREREQAIREEAATSTASRWKKTAFVSSGLAFVTAMILFMVVAVAITGHHPFRVEKVPTSQEVASRVSGLLASTFPTIKIEEAPGRVQLLGELATYRDLARLREVMEGVPLINYDGIQVRDEHFFPYRVRPGDSLTNLAVRFYGQKSRWRLIYDANRARLLNANLLKSGELLLIPLVKE
jgi:tetratricopeptide (TPR) repeat protein